jgi:site-specific recombinase XerD
MKRTTHEPTPDFWGYARDFLHDFLPNVREMAPRSIEAYRISLESYVHYLATEKQVRRQDIGFDHFNRQVLKDWLVWMRQAKKYLPATRTGQTPQPRLNVFLGIIGVKPNSA